MSSTHLSGYQKRDFEVVDYQMYALGNTGLQFRGPEPTNLRKDEYFACIGAAQTLGCFCETPFPALLEKSLGLPCINLGYGGAGPEFFLNHEELHPHINGARFVVLQIMSGRSQSNSYYDCDGLEYVSLRADGRKMGAQHAFFELYDGDKRLSRLLGNSRLAKRLRSLSVRPKVRRLVGEIRRNWVNTYVSLISKVDVPVVLFWFSKRTPEYKESYKRVGTLFGDFPQLVNREMVETIRRSSTAYVECVADRGSPQPLISRFSGRPVSVDLANDRKDFGDTRWTSNSYYPSPEMHEDAASELLQICQKFRASK